MTECQCATPGFCERHQVAKSPMLHKLCQHSQRYFDAWEAGNGPGQIKQRQKQPRRRVAPQQGPGKELRRILGCSAKRWTEYQRMDDLGVGCLEIITELADSLVAGGHVQTRDSAERLIHHAVERFRKIKPDAPVRQHESRG